MRPTTTGGMYLRGLNEQMKKIYMCVYIHIYIYNIYMRGLGGQIKKICMCIYVHMYIYTIYIYICGGQRQPEGCICAG